MLWGGLCWRGVPEAGNWGVRLLKEVRMDVEGWRVARAGRAEQEVRRAAPSSQGSGPARLAGEGALCPWLGGLGWAGLGSSFMKGRAGPAGPGGGGTKAEARWGWPGWFSASRRDPLRGTEELVVWAGADCMPTALAPLLPSSSNSHAQRGLLLARSRGLAMPFPLAQLSLALLLTLMPMPGLAGPVSTCDANGSLYYVGEWYFLNSDHCTQCECTAEGPACARTECAALPPACIHVSHYPSDCCPRCERVGCEHRGQVYELGQHFQPSECEQCTCDLDGIARCLVADCAPPPCVNPLYEKGHCCPTCKDGPNCYVDGSRQHVIPAGESVWVGPCTHCRCHDGQDAGYWEGNRVAKCEQLQGCRTTIRHHS